VLLDRFIKISTTECKLDVRFPVVAGVSGGIDSLVMLDLLVRSGFLVTVAHFDHQLRPNSAQDADYTGKVAQRYGCPFVRGARDVRAISEQARISIEHAARNARYSFLFELAGQIGAQGVLTGHTADDQVETVLMHLLRGSGLNGMQGMVYRRYLNDYCNSIPIVRPILKFWRKEIVEYCQLRGLKPVEDETNRELNYLRNRIRHALVPDLEQYNPRIKDRIWSMAAVITTSINVLDDAVSQAYRQAVIDEYTHFLVFNKAVFSTFVTGMTELVLRHGLRKIAPQTEDVGWENLLFGAAELRSERCAGEVDLADSIYLLFTQDRVYLALRGARLVERTWPAIKPDQIYTLPVPGILKIENDLALVAEIVNAPEGDFPHWVKDGDQKQAWFDADLLKFPLKVRTWRAGDRFQPFGREGQTVKLGDFLARSRLPRPARSVWGLVFSADELIWVPLVRPAHFCRITKASKNLLHLKITTFEQPTGGASY